MNILLCNGKGGTRKTTLSVLLAHALAEAGKKVAVLDHDPQGTATKWLDECEDKKVSHYNHSTKYDAVFIDTPAPGHLNLVISFMFYSHNRVFPFPRGYLDHARYS